MKGSKNRSISRQVGILKFVLVLSLLLNISMLVSAGYTHYKQSRYRVSPFGNGIQKPGWQNPNFLYEKLSLRPEQLRMMQQGAFTFHADLDKRAQDIDQKRIFLVTLMRADSLDIKAIEATILEINRLQQDVQKTAVAHMLEFKEMLDKNQQKQFLDLIEGEMTTASNFGRQFGRQ